MPRTTIAGSLRVRASRGGGLVQRRTDLVPDLGLELAEPLQCAEPGEKAILASPCHHKPGQSLEAYRKWTPRKAICIRVADRSGDRIFCRPSPEEASVIHPLRLDELELPP